MNYYIKLAEKAAEIGEAWSWNEDEIKSYLNKIQKKIEQAYKEVLNIVKNTHTNIQKLIAVPCPMNTGLLNTFEGIEQTGNPIDYVLMFDHKIFDAVKEVADKFGIEVEDILEPLYPHNFGWQLHELYNIFSESGYDTVAKFFMNVLALRKKLFIKASNLLKKAIKLTESDPDCAEVIEKFNKAIERYL